MLKWEAAPYTDYIKERLNMKHVKFFGLMLVAVLAFGVPLATSAFALPEFLPITSPNNTPKGINIGTSTFENSAGTQVKCTSAAYTGGFETDTLGTYHTEFKNCTAEGFPCETPADKKPGVILFGGSFHFVYDTLGSTTLGVANLYLVKETEYVCLNGLIGVVVKGLMLCLIKEPLTSTLSHAFKCEGEGSGKAKEKTFYNDGGTLVTVQLLANQNGGGFKESAEIAEGTVETVNAGAFMTE